jgi:hypothetical protein
LKFIKMKVDKEKLVRHETLFFAGLALALMPVILEAADARPFDGNWQTTVSCDASRGALGYSFLFESEVKDGVFHGLHGTAGEPGSVQIAGRIQADGTANLYAMGRTGSKEFVPGRDTPRGTEYGYHIEAQFKDKSGTGTRVQGRRCAFQFENQD